MRNEPKEAPAKVKPSKGSKAACEAAGWKFAPIAHIGETPTTINGRTTYHRYRTEGGRGTMAIPPVGLGIEPRQFGGSGRAIAWAVEQLAEVAKAHPDETPAGMDGIRLLLSAALASGVICGGPDETPERPDAELLSICKDALAGRATEDFYRAKGFAEVHAGGPSADKVFHAAIDASDKALERLPALHATTREGLLQKARASLLVFKGFTRSRVRQETVESLILDLIHLVPTLIDERGRSVVPPAGDAEVA